MSGIIRRHRSAARSRWRKLNPAKQALLALAHLRKGETFAELAAGFGVETANGVAVRERDSSTAGGPARVAKLCTAVRDAKKAGYAYVVLDETLNSHRPGRRGPGRFTRASIASTG